MDGAFAPWHIIVVALIFVVLFGAKRLPDSARALGQSLRIFKSETRGLRTDDKSAVLPAALPPQPRFDPYTGAPLTPPPGDTGPV
ncbi:MAG: Sec-independent protein translocase subunit TatA [Mycobacteriales bacterium]